MTPYRISLRHSCKVLDFVWKTVNLVSHGLQMTHSAWCGLLIVFTSTENSGLWLTDWDFRCYLLALLLVLSRKIILPVIQVS